MMKYGGIYLDNDVYVIKNLDKYRKFESIGTNFFLFNVFLTLLAFSIFCLVAMNWDEDQSLASQVIIAHKDARFL